MPPRRRFPPVACALAASSVVLAVLLGITWLKLVRLGSTVEVLQRDLSRLSAAPARVDGASAAPRGLVRFDLDVPGKGELFPAMAASEAPEYWPLATLRVTNSSRRPLAQTVSAEIPGWTLRADRSLVLAPGETRRVRIQPDLLPRAFENDEPQRAALEVRVTAEDASVLFEESRPVLIRGGSEIYWGRGFANAQVASRWVTPHAPAVLELVSHARRYVRRGRMAGYNTERGGSLEAQVRAQAAAIYRALQLSGPRRVLGDGAGPADASDRPQRLLLPVETLRLPSARAIDVAVVFASAVENLGMQPLIALVGGRALVGVRVGRNADEVLYVDPGGLPDTAFETALQRGRALVAQTPPAALLAVDVAAARALGLYPLAERGAGPVTRTASVRG